MSPKVAIASLMAVGIACSSVSDGASDGGSGDASRTDAGTGDAHTGNGDASAGNGNGNGSIAPITFSSGTRIKARTTTITMATTDGAQYSFAYFAGWLDSQRNEACTPSLASDGVTRCLPSAGAMGAFADAACSIPAAYYIESCGSAPPAYVSVPPIATCPPAAGPKLFASGPPTTNYYSKSGTTCSGPNTIAGWTWYPTSGPEIDPKLFVAITTTTVTQ